MSDFDNPDSFYWSWLMPGIRVWGAQHDCEFFMDGFVPAFRKDGKSVQIDMSRIVSLAKQDKYNELEEAIISHIGELDA